MLIKDVTSRFRAEASLVKGPFKRETITQGWWYPFLLHTESPKDNNTGFGDGLLFRFVKIYCTRSSFTADRNVITVQIARTVKSGCVGLLGGSYYRKRTICGNFGDVEKILGKL